MARAVVIATGPARTVSGGVTQGLGLGSIVPGTVGNTCTIRVIEQVRRGIYRSQAVPNTSNTDF